MLCILRAAGALKQIFRSSLALDRTRPSGGAGRERAIAVPFEILPGIARRVEGYAFAGAGALDYDEPFRRRLQHGQRQPTAAGRLH